MFESFFLSKDRTISLIMLMYVASAGLDVNWLFFGIEEFRITTIRNAVLRVILSDRILMENLRDPVLFHVRSYRTSRT